MKKKIAGRKLEQKIVPFLWFEEGAEKALKFYASVFKGAKITGVCRYGKEGPGKPGTVMTGTIEIAGQRFSVINGGKLPGFKFTPAISFFVNCATQKEVDRYWEKLSAGGKKIQCGWLTDKYGVTWQIVPTILGDLLGDDDEEKSARVMQAMRKIKKLDIAGLKRAHRGK